MADPEKLDHDPPAGPFGIPHPQGWPLERVLSLLAGSVVLTSLLLGRENSRRWRVLTAFVGLNLLLDAAVGWCPTSLLLYRLGIRTAAERALDRLRVG